MVLLKSKESPTFTEIQRFYFIQISIVDCCYAVVYLVKEILTFFSYPGIEKHLGILHFLTGVLLYVTYIGLMTLLTVDRFFAVYLHLRYHLFWTLYRAKVAFGCLIIFATMFIPLFMIEKVRTEGAWFPVLMLWPTMETIFMIVAVITYTYLFKKLRASRHIVIFRRSPQQPQQHHQQQPQPQQQQQQAQQPQPQQPEQHHQQQQQPQQKANRRGTIKKNNGLVTRGFFTPTLLVANFTVVFLIPDQVFFWYFVLGIERDETSLGHFLSHNLIYSLGFVSDAFIYILTKKEVRRVVKRMFKGRSP